MFSKKATTPEAESKQAATAKLAEGMSVNAAGEEIDKTAASRLMIPGVNKAVTKMLSPLIQLSQRLSYVEPQKLNTQQLDDNIFGFYSPTGGTGVTTLVANVAVLLANQNLNIAVVDFDLYYPSLFRFLLEEGELVENNLVDMFITSGANIPEFATSTKYPTLTLFSNRLDVGVHQLAELDIVNICQFLKNLAALYDYVLIDFKGNMNQESVMAAFEECYQVFTLTTPSVDSIERVYKDNSILASYDFGPKASHIVQAMVRDDGYTAEDFKANGMELIENLPYSLVVQKVGANHGIFISGNYGGDQPSQLYRDSVKHIAELILNPTMEGK